MGKKRKDISIFTAFGGKRNEIGIELERRERINERKKKKTTDIKGKKRRHENRK